VNILKGIGEFIAVTGGMITIMALFSVVELMR
jgi:hypothetical protein